MHEIVRDTILREHKSMSWKEIQNYIWFAFHVRVSKKEIEQVITGKDTTNNNERHPEWNGDNW